jgi:hypothetical protein
MPDAKNIVFVFMAKTYEEACRFAKEYRSEAFTVEEILQRKVKTNDRTISQSEGKHQV